MKLLFNMFLAFAKIGLFTFGGGYAMLPMLQKEIVDKYSWATEQELMDYYAVGQCTPGVIAVNTATFIGFKKKGIAGALVCTLGVIFPSVVIIAVIAALIQNFLDYEVVGYAMSGIRVCVCVLIFSSVIRLVKKSLIDVYTVVIFAVVLGLAVFTDISTPLFIVAAAVAGLLLNRGEVE